MNDKFGEFYEQVWTKQDFPDKDAHGWIQWKGTDVCIDLHCTCGHHGHIDAEFFYYYECPKCHVKFAVGQIVKLIPLTSEQIEYVEKNRGVKFQKPEPTAEEILSKDIED